MLNSIELIKQEQERVSKLPHHYDMYGHQPGCGVCYTLEDLGRDIRWLEGCPQGHPWDTHFGYVGGFSGRCQGGK